MIFRTVLPMKISILVVTESYAKSVLPFPSDAVEKGCAMHSKVFIYVSV